MTFPSLPTNSLYKFLFVGGVVLLFSSSFFIREIDKKAMYFGLKMDSLNKENQLVIRDFKNLENKLRESISAEEIEINRLKHRDYLDSIKIQSGIVEKDTFTVDFSEQNKLIKLQDSLTKFRADESQKASRLILDQYQNQVSDREVYVFLRISGSILMFLGMILWIPQQRRQDQILRRQRDLIEMEYKEKAALNVRE